MTNDDFPLVNFTISEAAKSAMEQMRTQYDAMFPDNPAAVPSVSWALFKLNSGVRYERVMVAFYQRNQVPEIAHGIQETSGVKLIFFTTHEHSPKFEGKVLDHETERGFLLREPASGEERWSRK